MTWCFFSTIGLLIFATTIIIIVHKFTRIEMYECIICLCLITDALKRGKKMDKYLFFHSFLRQTVTFSPFCFLSPCYLTWKFLSAYFLSDFKVHLTGRHFNDRAVYTCDDGYQIVGLEQVICNSNGHWSGAQPSCKQVTIIDYVLVEKIMAFKHSFS